MSTIINNPGNGESSGVGLIVGVVVVIVIAVLLYIFVLPRIRGGDTPRDANVNVDVNLPNGGGESGGGQGGQ